MNGVVGLGRGEMMQKVQGYNIQELEARKDVEGLIKALKEGDTEREQGNAAVALGRLKDKDAVKPLIETLNNPNENYQVRGRAAWALGEIEDTRAVEPLVETLLNKKEEQFVRGWAASSLGKIGDLKAIPALEEVVNDPGEDEDIRATALESVEKIIISKAIKIIKQAKKLRINASGAIEALKPTQEAFWNKDSEAIELAQQLKKETEKLIVQLRKLTIEKIHSSKLRIQEIEKHGGEVSRANELLKQARDACNSEEFVNAIKLAEEAEKVAKENRPELSIDFPSLVNKVKYDNETSLRIINKGSMSVTEGTVTLEGPILMRGIGVHRVNEEINQFENIFNVNLPPINAGEKKRIENIFIAPLVFTGELGIRINWNYKDGISREYAPPSIPEDYKKMPTIIPPEEPAFDTKTLTMIAFSMNKTLMDTYTEDIIKKIKEEEQKSRVGEEYKARYKYDLLDDLKEAANAQKPEKILLYLDIIKKSGVFNLDKVESDADSIIGEVQTMYERGEKITSDCRDRVIELWEELKKLA